VATSDGSAGPTATSHARAADAEAGAGTGAEGDARPVVAARDVVREYETGGQTLRALKGVDVAVHPGEFVTVVGPSGSGKSTLLNALGLLDVPTSGRVTVRGTDVASLSIRERTRTRRRTVGFVFQSFHLLPTLTAKQNVMVPRLPVGDPDGAADRAASLLDRVGLGDRLDHHPDELSGGQKQRVAVARSLINEPDLVLADEPTGNLDRDTGTDVLELFEEITDDGVALVTVTHDELVETFADRTVRLVDGRVEAVESSPSPAPAPGSADDHEPARPGDAEGTAAATAAATGSDAAGAGLAGLGDELSAAAATDDGRGARGDDGHRPISDAWASVLDPRPDRGPDGGESVGRRDDGEADTDGRDRGDAGAPGKTRATDRDRRGEG
jgi:putative ABC transport system ATP-binding protein